MMSRLIGIGIVLALGGIISVFVALNAATRSDEEKAVAAWLEAADDDDVEQMARLTYVPDSAVAEVEGHELSQAMLDSVQYPSGWPTDTRNRLRYFSAKATSMAITDKDRREFNPRSIQTSVVSRTSDGTRVRVAGGMLGSGDAVTLVVRMQDGVWRLDFETVQDG